MPDDPIADKSFFLTRQIANLMEDFTRETSRSSSIYLLYGEASVGKSRVLDELVLRHFSGSVINRIDFSKDIDRLDENDGSAKESSNDFPRKIQRLMQDAVEHEFIIIDHFESASNKARHQMFQTWAIDGLDKKLNMIIAADTGHLDEVRQLAKQYQANVKSFYLKPFSVDEIEAFVSFYLFPTESSGRLSIPGDIRQQLKHSRGLVGKLIEIMSREGVAKSITIADKSATLKKPLILASIISVLLLVVGFLYPLYDQQEEPPLQSANNDVIELPELKPKQPAILKKESLPKQSVVDQSLLEADKESVPQEPGLARQEQTIEAALDSPQVSTISHRDEDNLEQEALAPVDDGAMPTDSSDPELTRFQQELNKSLAWIENSDKNRGTIQIMSIGFDGFADNTYYDYLDKLSQQDIDVSRVRIFQTIITGLVVYSVIYGEYDDRREASKSIPLLPEALNANKPIPRTIGGIWDEIFLKQ